MDCFADNVIYLTHFYIVVIYLVVIGASSIHPTFNINTRNFKKTSYTLYSSRFFLVSLQRKVRKGFKKQK